MNPEDQNQQNSVPAPEAQAPQAPAVAEQVPQNHDPYTTDVANINPQLQDNGRLGEERPKRRTWVIWLVVLSCATVIVLLAGAALIYRSQVVSQPKKTATQAKNVWPGNFPVSLVTYPDGQFTSEYSRPESNEWGLSITGSSVTSMNGFLKKLESNGWKTEDPSTLYGVKTTGVSKDGYVLAVSYVDSPNTTKFLIRISNIAENQELPANTTILN